MIHVRRVVHVRRVDVPVNARENIALNLGLINRGEAAIFRCKVLDDVAPSSSIACASSKYSSNMRLPMKPKQTPETTPTLPMRFDNAMAVATTSCAVIAPRTISNSRMILAGLKKCRPSTSCGRFVAAAIASTLSVEVLLARCARFHDLIELAENLLLDGHALEHGLNHEVDVGEACELERGDKSIPSRLSLL
jgi:hypothetical protein